MENGSEVNSLYGTRLEQVYINKPEVTVYYFSSEAQNESDIVGFLDGEPLQLVSLGDAAASEENTCYFVLLDVSASIYHQRFASILNGLNAFVDQLGENERAVFITFGESVRTVCDIRGDEAGKAEAREAIAPLTNYEMRTMLFEAISQMSAYAEKLPSEGYVHRVALVITDGEDIAEGVSTRTEALNALVGESIPVYGFAYSDGNRDALNSFGEFCRENGGSLSLLTYGAEGNSFTAAAEEIRHAHKAVFQGSSNKVGNSLVSFTLKNRASGTTAERKTREKRWITDAEAPALESVAQSGTRQLRVTFSEPVEGAGSSDNYHLVSGEKEVIPMLVSTGRNGTSAVLTFDEDFAGGEYELVCTGITDASMEKNELEGSWTLELEGVPEEEPQSPQVIVVERETEKVVEKEPEKTEEIVVEEEVPAETPPAPFYRQYAPFLIGGGIALLLVLLLTALLIRSRKKKKAAAKESSATGAGVRQHVRVVNTLEKKTIQIRINSNPDEMPVEITSSLIVGRSEGCDLSLDDPSLSRQHFVLALDHGNVVLQNLSATQDTKLNGRMIGNNPVQVRPGDTIEAGRIKLSVRW